MIRRVLVVEDNPADHVLVSHSLDRARGRFELDWARRLADARALLADSDYDAIILDLHLPDSEKEATVPAIRQVAPAVPIVVLTGSSDERFGVEAVGQGAQEYLLKSEALVDTVLERAIRYAIARLDAERDLRDTREQLLQAQKMESIGRLAGGIAHDLNNVLTAIFAFGNLVFESLNPDDPAYEDMREVLRASRRAESITRQLLTFCRRQAVSPRLVAVDELVGEIERMLRRILGEDIELRSIRAPIGGRVRIDPSAFQQVLINLAVNARDAMPGGGRLTIETGTATLTPAELARMGADAAPGEYAFVAMTDTGVGMDAATRARVFEPFFTTKPPGRGTGLGLSTAYGFISQAGGVIRVESERGQGARFTIFLPLAGDAIEARPDLPEPTAVGGDESILVVEDDHQVRKLAARALARAGYRVEEAAGGAEALALCSDRPGAFDLLLTDVIMPGISGKRLAQRLAQHNPALKVLFMSGYTPAALARHGVLDPAIALLQKPFSPHGIAAGVRHVLDTEGHLARDVGEPRMLVASTREALVDRIRERFDRWEVVSARTADEAHLMLASRELDAAVTDGTIDGLDPDKLVHYLQSRDPLLAEQTLIVDHAQHDDGEIVKRLEALLD